MPICTHHWRQSGQLSSPFVCVRCGDSKLMDTCFDDIQERRAASHRDPVATNQAINKTHSLWMMERTRDVSESISALISVRN